MGVDYCYAHVCYLGVDILSDSNAVAGCWYHLGYLSMGF